MYRTHNSGKAVLFIAQNLISSITRDTQKSGYSSVTFSLKEEENLQIKKLTLINTYFLNMYFLNMHPWKRLAANRHYFED
jgi:hypothetical protein